MVSIGLFKEKPTGKRTIGPISSPIERVTTIRSIERRADAIVRIDSKGNASAVKRRSKDVTGLRQRTQAPSSSGGVPITAASSYHPPNTYDVHRQPASNIPSHAVRGPSRHNSNGMPRIAAPTAPKRMPSTLRRHQSSHSIRQSSVRSSAKPSNRSPTLIIPRRKTTMSTRRFRTGPRRWLQYLRRVLKRGSLVKYNYSRSQLSRKLSFTVLESSDVHSYHISSFQLAGMSPRIKHFTPTQKIAVRQPTEKVVEPQSQRQDSANPVTSQNQDPADSESFSGFEYDYRTESSAHGSGTRGVRGIAGASTAARKAGIHKSPPVSRKPSQQRRLRTPPILRRTDVFQNKYPGIQLEPSSASQLSDNHAADGSGLEESQVDEALAFVNTWSSYLRRAIAVRVVLRHEIQTWEDKQEHEWRGRQLEAQKGRHSTGSESSSMASQGSFQDSLDSDGSSGHHSGQESDISSQNTGISPSDSESGPAGPIEPADIVEQPNQQIPETFADSDKENDESMSLYSKPSVRSRTSLAPSDSVGAKSPLAPSESVRGKSFITPLASIRSRGSLSPSDSPSISSFDNIPSITPIKTRSVPMSNPRVILQKDRVLSKYSSLVGPREFGTRAASSPTTSTPLAALPPTPPQETSFAVLDSDRINHTKSKSNYSAPGFEGEWMRPKKSGPRPLPAVPIRARNPDGSRAPVPRTVSLPITKIGHSSNHPLEVRKHTRNHSHAPLHQQNPEALNQQRDMSDRILQDMYQELEELQARSVQLSDMFRNQLRPEELEGGLLSRTHSKHGSNSSPSDTSVNLSRGAVNRRRQRSHAMDKRLSVSEQNLRTQWTEDSDSPSVKSRSSNEGLHTTWKSGAGRNPDLVQPEFRPSSSIAPVV